MTYANHIVGDQVRPCRIKRRGRNNCRVIWLDNDEEQLVPRVELHECTAEEAGVDTSVTETPQVESPEPVMPAITGQDLSRMMRNFQVTISDLARKLGVSESEVRRVRREGVTEAAVASEWQQAICGDGQPEPENGELVPA